MWHASATQEGIFTACVFPDTPNVHQINRPTPPSKLLVALENWMSAASSIRFYMSAVLPWLLPTLQVRSSLIPPKDDDNAAAKGEMDQFSVHNKELKTGRCQDAERNMCASVVLGICMPYLETKQNNTQSYAFGQHGQACKGEGIKHGSAVGKGYHFSLPARET